MPETEIKPAHTITVYPPDGGPAIEVTEKAFVVLYQPKGYDTSAPTSDQVAAFQAKKSGTPAPVAFAGELVSSPGPDPEAFADAIKAGIKEAVKEAVAAATASPEPQHARKKTAAAGDTPATQ